MKKSNAQGAMIAVGMTLGAGLAVSGASVAVYAQEESGAVDESLLQNQINEAASDTQQKADNLEQARDELQKADEKAGKADAAFQQADANVSEAENNLASYHNPDVLMPEQEALENAKNEQAAAGDAFFQDKSDELNEAIQKAEDTKVLYQEALEYRDSLLADIAGTEEELQELKKQQAAVLEEIPVLETQRDNLLTELDEASDNTLTAENSLQEAEKQMNGIQAQVDKAQAEYDKAQQEYEALEKELENKRLAVEAAWTELKEAEKLNTKFHDELVDAEAAYGSLIDLEAALHTLEGELADLETKKTDAVLALEQETDNLAKAESAYANSQKKLEEASRQLEEALIAQAESEKDVKEKQRDLQEKTAARSEFIQKYEEAARAKTEADSTRYQKIQKQIEKLHILLAEVNDQYAKGSLGFFEHLAETDPSAKEAVWILKRDKQSQFVNVFHTKEFLAPYPNYTAEKMDLLHEEYYSHTHIGADGDATSLENMRIALGMLLEGNERRVNAEDKDGNKLNLAPFSVSSAMLAVGQVYNNALRETKNESACFFFLNFGNYSYTLGLSSAERPAADSEELQKPWSEASAETRELYSSAYADWYEKEKTNLNNQSGDSYNYSLIIRKYNRNYYATTAWSQDFSGKCTWTQLYSEGDESYYTDDNKETFYDYGTAYTPEEYEKIFLTYYNDIINRQNELQARIAWLAAQLEGDTEFSSPVHADDEKLVAELEAACQKAEAELQDAVQALESAEEKIYEAQTVLNQANSALAAAIKTKNSAQIAQIKAEDTKNTLKDVADKAEMDKNQAQQNLDSLKEQIKILTEERNACQDSFDIVKACTDRFEKSSQKVSEADETLQQAQKEETESSAKLAEKLPGLSDLGSELRNQQSLRLEQRRVVANKQEELQQARRNEDGLQRAVNQIDEQLHSDNESLEEILSSIEDTERILNDSQQWLLEYEGYVLKLEASLNELNADVMARNKAFLMFFQSETEDESDVSPAALLYLEEIRKDWQAISDQAEAAVVQVQAALTERIAELEKAVATARVAAEAARNALNTAVAEAAAAKQALQQAEQEYQAALNFEQSLRDLREEIQNRPAEDDQPGPDEPGGNDNPGTEEPGGNDKPGPEEPGKTDKPGESEQPGSSQPAEDDKPKPVQPGETDQPGPNQPDTDDEPGMVKPGANDQPEPEKPAETQKPGVSEPEKGDRKPASGRRPQTSRPVQTQTLVYVQPVESEWLVRFRPGSYETMTGSFMALENPLEVKVQASGTASKKTKSKASKAGSGIGKTKKKASGTGKQVKETVDSSLEAMAEDSKRLAGKAGDVSRERISHSGEQERGATEAMMSTDSNVRNWSLWLTAAGGMAALLLGNRWRKKNR